MNAADSLLDDVRYLIASDDRILQAARERQEAVQKAAMTFSHALRTFTSGSLAHRTANDPVQDADGGVVLNRVHYADLGPDGGGLGPCAVVEAARGLLRDRLRDDYPKVGFRLTKRAIKVSFDDPMTSEKNSDLQQDPTVDVIVALTRKDGALWIPHLKNDAWDASDPEKHTELLEEAYAQTGHSLQRAIRLAKAWNRQYSEPALSSFNVEALGLEAIAKPMGAAEALRALFSHGADSLAEARTKDPADVSGPIRILVDRDVAVDRLRKAAQRMDSAIEAADDVEAARTNLADVFWTLLEAPPGVASKAAVAAALSGSQGLGFGAGGSVHLGNQGRQLKPTRSFGGAGAPR